MFGRIVAIIVVFGAGLSLVAVASAQQESRRPTLSERLQRFRQEVFGGPSESRSQPPVQNQSPAAGAARKIHPPQQSVRVAPSQPEPTLAPEFQQSQGGQIEMPRRMQIQGARRAQAGQSPVTVITPGAASDLPSEEGSSLRRPVQEARRRALGEPVETEVVEPMEPTLAVQPEEADLESGVGAADFASDGEIDVEQVAPYAPGEDGYDESAAVDSEDSATPDSTTVQPRFSNALRPEPEPILEPEPVEAAPEEPLPAAEPEQTFADTPLDEMAVEPADGVLFTARSPVLAVEASGPRTVMIGKEAAFEVRVRNSGAPANQVVVKIVVPNYADVASSRATAGTSQPPSRTEINSGLEWAIDRLESGAEETLTLKLVPRKSSPLDLAISYTFTPETSQTMVEVQEPKLAMNLAGPSEVLFGQTKIYKLTISNPGNGDTHNVSVTLLPIGNSGEAPGTHSLGTLLAGESKTIDIELTARQAGALAIKAQSFADGGLRAEAAQEIRVRRAALNVAVEAPSVKYAGTPATYSLLVENTGDAMAENVSLSATLPPEAKFLAASGGRLDPQQARVTWNVGSLPAGGQRSFELQCALHSPGDNQLQVSAQGAGELSAATATSTRVEAIADLKLEVRDPQGPVAVGDDAIYEIRVRNRGTKAAQRIDLAVFFSEGLEPSAADGGKHSIGVGQVIFEPVATLGAGETAVFHVKARAAQAGNHVFRAEVICESLDTKLAAEEATHFYGDQIAPLTARREPTLAQPPAALDPNAVDAPPVNPYE